MQCPAHEGVANLLFSKKEIFWQQINVEPTPNTMEWFQKLAVAFKKLSTPRYW
jgi:hypothetical protein